MADYNSNIIKPVESPQNIPGLTGAKDRERKKRQHPSEENLENPQRERRKTADGQNPRNKSAKKEDERRSIDFCA